MAKKELINAENLEGDISKIWGDAKNIYGNASELEGDVSNIRGDVSYILGDVSNIEGNVSSIEGDVSNIRGNVSHIWGDVSDISGDVSDISGDVSKIYGDVSFVYGDVSHLEGDVSDLREDKISELSELNDYNSIVKQLKRDIKKAKDKLIAKAKKSGVYENFGQKELRDIVDKYGEYVYSYEFKEAGGLSALQEFENWVEEYTPYR